MNLLIQDSIIIYLFYKSKELYITVKLIELSTAALAAFRQLLTYDSDTLTNCKQGRIKKKKLEALNLTTLIASAQHPRNMLRMKKSFISAVSAPISRKMVDALFRHRMFCGS